MNEMKTILGGFLFGIGIFLAAIIVEVLFHRHLLG